MAKAKASATIQPTKKPTNQKTSQSSTHPTNDPPGGLQCHQCGGRRFKVLQTRRVLDSILRRRGCTQCGLRFTTREHELFRPKKRRSGT